MTKKELFFVPLQHYKSYKMAKKVLFINQEITPYVPETEMSILGRDLPQKTQEAGFEIRTFMPKWGTINERRGQLHEVIRLSGMNLIIDETDHPLIIKVASIPTSRLQIYFIDNDDYFQKRQMSANESGDDYADNGERAIFYARGVLETVKKLRWTPDIIVCQGWISAVVPFYIKKAFNEEPSFANAKVITSFHENQLKSDLGEDFTKLVDFKEAQSSLLEGYAKPFDFMELGKLAIDYSDGIIEAGKDVNPELLAYAKEKNIPVMSNPGDDYAQSYADFFNKIAGE
ncbi:glycogen synthase-like protein [Segatella baroniae B14]|jgi:starch synthase|uniref:starch synthase n=2 Tax=Segatella TaxID=2974251 RepID=D8DWA9_9BACT|nr:glycogen synthase-like protein [Segatella baroniae B14]